ncbi:MAG: fasciclin domain-containing protein [Actinomycetota bacterium]
MIRTRSRSLRVLAAAASLALVAAACGDDDADTEEPTTEETAAPAADGNIVEVATAAGDFSTLVAAVDAAGLVETLSGEGPFTVFAPTDDAFAALPEGLVEALLEDTETLGAILTYHVVAGEVLAADVVELTEAETVNGESVAITVTDDGGVMVDDANVVQTDIGATNGVIHVIDAVIIPEGVVLPDHGGDDMEEMDEEMSDEEMTDEEMTDDTEAADAGPGTIVDVAAAAGSFETLLAAAEAAGLVDTLTGEGPLTVFAPTDDAFAALPEGTVEGLLEDPETLASILTLHVVAGAVPAADVVGLTEAATVNGEVLPVVVDGDTVMIGTATVVQTDIEASNGIIHVIDSVLLPSS